jgi:predicted  nucleic acid-binding Zn-ribbon protein
MNPALKHLSELQAVDLSLNQLRARLAEFPRRFAEVDARLAAARGDVTSAKESLLGSQKARKKFELDVEQWKESARKYRDQSFQVKTNEAFKALQHEISNAEAEMARAEDRLLERMMAGEEFERRVPAAARALVEAEAATAAERRAIETEKAAAEKELTAAQAAYDEAARGVPEDLLEDYQKIAVRRHGIGLAEVRHESCGQCGVRILPHVVQDLGRAGSEDIFHCETCTRILWLADSASAAAGSAFGAESPGAERRED